MVGYKFVLLVVCGIFASTSANTEEQLQDISFNEIETNQNEEQLIAKCIEKGFNPETLLCSSCDLLDEYALSGIKTDCSKCCKADAEEWSSVTPKKYSKAILEVCNCKLGSLPHLTDFLKSDLRKNYPTFIQKHVNGVWPTISLINENGSIERTFSITKWNRETIVEFLDTYLIN